MITQNYITLPSGKWIMHDRIDSNTKNIVITNDGIKIDSTIDLVFYPLFSLPATHFPDFLVKVITPMYLPLLYTFPYSVLMPKKALTMLPFL